MEKDSWRSREGIIAGKKSKQINCRDIRRPMDREAEENARGHYYKQTPEQPTESFSGSQVGNRRSLGSEESIHEMAGLAEI